ISGDGAPDLDPASGEQDECAATAAARNVHQVLPALAVQDPHIAAGASALETEGHNRTVRARVRAAAWHQVRTATPAPFTRIAPADADPARSEGVRRVV